jgi:hypothetical protein
MFCAAPASVRIEIDFYRRTIHLAREALPDRGCLDALILHAEKHAEAEERAHQEFIVSAKQSLANRLLLLKQVPTPTRAEAAERFSAGLKNTTEESVLIFAGQRPSVRKTVDTPAEIARLNAACEDVLKKLVHGI